MDPGDQRCSLEDFSHWKIEALRSFLSQRGLSIGGNKQELVALAFAANTLNMPIIPTAVEIEKSKLECYKNLLKVGDVILPDPFLIFDKWEDETQGMSHWPPVFITDVTTFLMKYESEEKAQLHLNQYKIGKAYEYYTSEWLKEVFYHPISTSSPYCFLRARCTPSQSLNAATHSAWVCLQKATGHVLSAYCSCTSGLGQTCNHVAGLLFRIESANKLGLTSCTSGTCIWVKPSEKKLQPAQIKNMNFKKSRHGKSVTRPLVGKSKADYDVMPEANNDTEACIQKTLLASLKDAIPNACVFKGMHTTDDQDTTQLPVPVNQKETADVMAFDVSNYYIDNMVKNNVEHVTETEVQAINNLTMGQSSNPNWTEMRKGRITASNFYAVHTKVESYKRNAAHCDIKPLLSRIMGYKHVNPNVMSLKYGREMEPIAKIEFMKMYRKKHKDVSFDECGIFLDVDHPYLAASPDLLVSCSCCGEGLVEFKCPLIPKCSTCFSFCKCNLPSCLQNTESLTLKHGAYYGQIQGQIELTKRKWCILYIYTCNGPFYENIVFDQHFYSEMSSNLEFFYHSFVLPEIHSRSLQHLLTQESLNVHTPEPMEIDNKVHVDGETYFCPECNMVVMNEVTKLKERSIYCDECRLWYHFHCVGITDKYVKSLTSWHCKKCIQSSS